VTAPFRAPHVGREAELEYVSGAFAGERYLDVRFGEPVEIGGRAVVEWWGLLRQNGRETTLAGASVLRFDADGLVAESRDYWHMEDGHGPPPEGWGR
jgi:hypothetical protein